MYIANNGFRSIGSGAGALAWFVVYDSDRNREASHIKLRNEYYMYVDDTFFVATIVIG